MTPLIAVFVAGVVVSGVALVTLGVMRRATFATQALVLQALTAVLLLASLGALLPRVAAAPLGAPDSAIAVVRAPAAAALTGLTLRALTLIWIAGIVLALLRTVAAIVRLAGIRRRAEPGSHDVLVSDEVDLPFVHGWRSPAIIVPRSSESWSAEVWQAVLAHERAHITRGDVAMRLLRQLTLSLHWLNPAVHWLIARTDHACEGACDDAVLLAGAEPRGYIATLLSFAHVPWAFAAVSTIVGLSGLEARVAGIVERERARRPARRGDRTTPRMLGLAGGVALALIMPHPVLTMQEVAQIPAARAQARLDDTTAAIVGLTSLLTDPSPIVRQTAREALLAWEHAGASVFHRRKERTK